MSHSISAIRVREALEAGGAEDLERETAVATSYLHQLSALPKVQEAVLQRLRSGESPYAVAGRYPLQTVRGVMSLAVNTTVMPPGGDTQAVADLVAELAPQVAQLVIDVGCGTGVLGIAALAATSATRGLFIDLSWDACALVSLNLSTLGLAERAAVVQGRGLETLRQAGPKALVVANLPFVPTNALPLLPSRYSEFAPRIAVDGGADGLDTIRRVVDQAASRLSPGSVLVLQHADDQGYDVARALDERWAVEASLSLSAATVAKLGPRGSIR